MNYELDIIDTAIAAGQFSTLTAALGAAGLIGTLKGAGPFTVFAPTDDAFAKLSPQLVSDLLQPEKRELLKSILLSHVVPGKLSARDLVNLVSGPQTLEGETLKVNTAAGLRIADAKVTISDVETTNGVIHIIDSVILPVSAAVAS